MGMQRLMTEIANMYTYEKLAEDLQSATTEYLISPTDENKEKLITLCGLMTTKSVLENSFQNDTDKMTEQFETFKKREDLFNPSKN